MGTRWRGAVRSSAEGVSTSKRIADWHDVENRVVLFPEEALLERYAGAARTARGPVPGRDPDLPLVAFPQLLDQQVPDVAFSEIVICASAAGATSLTRLPASRRAASKAPRACANSPEPKRGEIAPGRRRPDLPCLPRRRSSAPVRARRHFRSSAAPAREREAHNASARQSRAPRSSRLR